MYLEPRNTLLRKSSDKNIEYTIIISASETISRIWINIIGQQIIKQNPQYYAFYVALRPDYAWRLISYPYYVKFAKPGDYTSFRYINISIPKYLEIGRGGNLI